MATSRKPETKQKPKSGDLREIGESGVNHFAGYIDQEETNSSLKHGKWVEIANKMYREEVSVRAAFTLATLPVLLAEWKYSFHDDGKGSQEVMDYAKQIWENSDHTWHECLQQIVFYLLYGNFPFEKVFKIQDGKIWLKKLGPRKPTFNSKFILDNNGELETYKQWARNLPNGGWQWFDIPASKLVFFVHDNVFGNNYEGISAFRAAYRPYRIKSQLVESDKLRHYRFNAPIPEFEEPEDEPSKNEDVRKENRRTVEAMAAKFRSGRHSYIIVPNGWKFKLIQPDIGTNTTLDSVKYHDNQIFLASLSNLIGMGTTSTATQGLGETMSAMGAMYPTNIAKYIGEVVSSQLIKPLIDMNFGPQEHYPKFFASNVQQSTIKDILPFVVSALQGGGLHKDLSVENFLRDRIGIRQITQEEHEKNKSESTANGKTQRKSIRSVLSPASSTVSTQSQPGNESDEEN